MSAKIRVPTERACLDCGREEVWNAETEYWAVDGDAVGDVHCIHDWDITGQFTPVEK